MAGSKVEHPSTAREIMSSLEISPSKTDSGGDLSFCQSGPKSDGNFNKGVNAVQKDKKGKKGSY